MPPRIVTDIEIHWRTPGADPLVLTVDDARGDQHDVGDDGTRRYHLQRDAGLTDIYLIAPGDVRYVRFLQRHEEEPPPVYAGDGVRVSGELPIP